MRELEDITIDHYHIERRLAHGGMSEIYLAQDLVSKQMVAIKLVHESNRDYYERFRHEVQIVSALQHEHILPALDYGAYEWEDEAWYYLVTPYISYGTLNDRLMLGALSLEEAGEILEQLIGALQFAHEQQIIHRDIKPSNVLLQDGKHVYLADFGLAKKVGETRGFTLSGIMMGTPEYIAPELAEEPATERSDIYALGVLLYQMLTGKVPFSASTPLAIFFKHVSEEPQRPSLYNAEIPVSVEKVILRALEKDPQKRFRTAASIMKAYRRAMEVETPELGVLEEYATLDIPTYRRQTLPQDKPALKLRSHSTVVAMGVACLLLLFTLSLSLTSYEPPSAASSQVGATPTITSGYQQTDAQATPTGATHQKPDQPSHLSRDPQQKVEQKGDEIDHGGKIGDSWAQQPVEIVNNESDQKNETGEQNNGEGKQKDDKGAQHGKHE